MTETTERQIGVPALQVDDLHKRFGNHEVLKGISLTAQIGDVISIIGSSGSGKSTFLRCINLLETPDAGEVRVHGELIAMKTLRNGARAAADEKQMQRIRTRLGMVFQSFNLWAHKTIIDNITEAPVHVLGRSKAEATEQADALLQKVGLYERRDYYPNHLSGGQQQRAAIARALVQDARIVLADEPTANLDSITGTALLDTMQEINHRRGTTFVFSTHDSMVMQHARRIVRLHDGRLVEDSGA